MTAAVSCSPHFNWRSVQAPEQHYIALFPTRPEKSERKVKFQDQEISQFFEAGKVGGDIFSISAIALNQDQNNLQGELLDVVKKNVLSLADVTDDAITSVESTYETAGHQRIPVKDYYFKVVGAENSKTMRVRWILFTNSSSQSWLYQISVLHIDGGLKDSKSLLANQDYSMFFNEFHPL